MTQDGTRKLIENTLKAKEDTRQWREVSLVLAEALGMLDFHDVDNVAPYSCINEINKAIQENDLKTICRLLNIG